MQKSTITITYGETVENHVGNQQIGNEVEDGISYDQLKIIKDGLKLNGYKCKFHDLGDLLKARDKDNASKAGILVVKNFVNTFFKKDDADDKLFEKLVDLNWDKKAFMKGRVVNKKARYNLCFADFSQSPKYEEGKGRVYDFKDLKELQKIRKIVEKLSKVPVNAEGNYYFNKDECYIGFHGDSERKVVVGVRLGATFPLYYQWYRDTEPVTEPYKINLKHGDLYIMSDKAVGHDWKKRKILTLRHSAGNLDNHYKH